MKMSIEYRLEHIEQDLIEHEKQGVKFGTYSNEGIRELIKSTKSWKESAEWYMKCMEELQGKLESVCPHDDTDDGICCVCDSNVGVL
jgi:hypothetical protein